MQPSLEIKKLPAENSEISTTWNKLNNTEDGFETLFRAAWSDAGLHFEAKMECDCIHSPETLNDYDDLFEYDTIEFFLQPNPNIPLYLECEISPHNKELILLVSQYDGNFLGWRPWHYTTERLAKHEVLIEPNSWSVNLFIPFMLMYGLPNTPPKAGDIWHFNVCRIDFNKNGERSLCTYAPISKPSFHNLKDFAKLSFM